MYKNKIVPYYYNLNTHLGGSYMPTKNNRMKSLFISLFFKNKGLLFFAMAVSPFFDWLSRILNLEAMPVRLLFLIIVFVIVDMVTGLAASRKNGEEITSKKGFRSVWKLVYYTLFLYAISQVGLNKVVVNSDFLKALVGYIELSVFTLAILWEMHSWGENLKRLHGKKPRLFTFIEVIAGAFEKLLISNVKKIEEIQKKTENKS